MDMLRKLFNRGPFAPVVPTAEVASTIPKPVPLSEPILVIPAVVPLKKLKWVMTPKGIGIVTKIDDGGYCNVDLVGESGSTYMSTREHPGNIRLARYMEIPSSRRPNDPAYAATLGYT